MLAGVQIGLGVVILARVFEGRGPAPWLILLLLLTIPPTIMLRARPWRRG